PGQFNTISELGGRSGIRAAGADVAPLIINATLFGNDNDNIIETGSADREFGLLFEENTNQARLANIAIVNFRNGCYEVGADVDLSTMSLNGEPESHTSFVDGIHCTNEFISSNPPDPLRALRFGGVDIPVALRDINNGQGLRSYNNNIGQTANFAGEGAGGVAGFTAGWFLDSMAGLANGGAGLNRYNGGDTDDSGNTTASDVDFQPLFNSSDNPLFGGVFDFAAEDEGFDLTIVGAIRSRDSGEAAQFDGWTLQDGAVDPPVTGYQF
ncbi:MAG: hypothetical protein WBN40_06905, partial [Pseudomonadales bacterium]